MIERDKSLRVKTQTAEQAKEFFRLNYGIANADVLAVDHGADQSGATFTIYETDIKEVIR